MTQRISWPMAALLLTPVVLTSVSLFARVSWRWLDGDLIRLVDVTSERNIPTWYSSGVLLLAGVSAAGIFVFTRGRAARAEGLVWLAVAVLMLLMSLDELVSLHEQLGRALQPAIQDEARARAGTSLDGILGTGWIIPGVLVVVALAAGLALAYRSAPRRLRLPFVLGFAVLTLGALGMEVVSALVYDRPIPLLLASHVEEFLEMIGGAMMLLAILRCARLDDRGDLLEVTYQPR
jgi:hypothetical protein